MLLPIFDFNNAMLKFLKKYKFRILGCLLFSFAELYVLPKQKSYYFENDIADFKTSSFHVSVVIFESLALIVVIIAVLKFVKSLKELARMSVAVVYSGVVSFFAAGLFHSLFLCAALFLNRQVTNGEVKKKYTVELKEIKGVNKYQVFLYYFELNKSVIEYFELTKSQYEDINEYDKIELTFTKGWFGLDYSPAYSGKVK